MSMTTAEVEARRRLELELHEGAQERLTLAALTLRRALTQVNGTIAAPLVAEAFEQLQEGLAALRELGRGIHPYVLGRYGLATALEGLAARAPLPIELRVMRERLQPAAEAAIYFAVEEALANVGAHASATRATVAVWRTADAVVAEIVDDGVGGAIVRDGSRLQGAVDRLESFAGRLELDSPRGAGTRLRAVAPVGLAVPAWTPPAWDLELTREGESR